MDGDKFFGTPGVVSLLPAGWENVGEVMSKAQDEALAKLAPAQYAPIAKTPAGAVAFTNVKLYDADARKFRDGMTVVVSNGIVSDEGPSKKIKVPAGAQVIDGTGKTLIPGLWDNHQHYGDDSRLQVRCCSHPASPACAIRVTSENELIGAQEAHR